MPNSVTQENRGWGWIVGVIYTDTRAEAVERVRDPRRGREGPLKTPAFREQAPEVAGGTEVWAMQDH